MGSGPSNDAIWLVLDESYHMMSVLLSKWLGLQYCMLTSGYEIPHTVPYEDRVASMIPWSCAF